MKVEDGRTIELPNEKLIMNHETRGPLTKHTCIQSPFAFSKPNNK